MQLIGRATDHTFASITIPDLELDGGRYYSSPFWPQRYWSLEVFLPFHGFKAKLKYRSTVDQLNPRVHKMKHAVVGPYARVDLFIHADTLRITPSSLVFGSREFELAILRWSAVKSNSRLVHRFRVFYAPGARFVMAFVDENSSVSFNPIFIRSVVPQRHQNYGMCAAYAEIHIHMTLSLLALWFLILGADSGRGGKPRR